MTVQRFTKADMARSVAQAIAPGSFVNLGIGLPELVADYLPPNAGVFLHSENGILGMGPTPTAEERDWDLINAGKKPVTLVQGGAFFHHADSFAMIRGGHIGLCVMGAFEVSIDGDLANWNDGSPTAIPAVGGAMDLAVGAREVFVMMNLLDRGGGCKLVPQLRAPVTAARVVTRLFTDHADFMLTPGCRPRVTRRAPGLTAGMLGELLGIAVQ